MPEVRVALSTSSGDEQRRNAWNAFERIRKTKPHATLLVLVDSEGRIAAQYGTSIPVLNMWREGGAKKTRFEPLNAALSSRTVTTGTIDNVPVEIATVVDPKTSKILGAVVVEE